MEIQELLQTMGEALKETATVKKVFGEPVTTGDRTVIPVAEVRYGFGGGGAPGKRAGGGGKVSATPRGALEITPERTRFVPFVSQRQVWGAMAAGFALGALVAGAISTKRVEIVKR